MRREIRWLNFYVIFGAVLTRFVLPWWAVVGGYGSVWALREVCWAVSDRSTKHRKVRHG